MLPAAVMVLLAVAVVTYVLAVSSDSLSAATVAILGVAVAVGAAVLLVAANRTAVLAGSIQRRVDTMRSSAAWGRMEVRRLLEQMHRGERPALQAPNFPPVEGDVFGPLEHDLYQTHHAAQTAVLQASAMGSRRRGDQPVEIFVNLSRRLQSLVHREIQLLDELENEVEDPYLLKGLFQVDHLATRVRRHAENLAVLGGAVSRRQWRRPVAMTEVLRSAIAEVEQYSRVKLIPPVEGTLRGHAVADVIHLVAELVENATNFSPPHTQVMLRARAVAAGLAVEVEDRGLGMALDDQDRVNGVLADPEGVNIAELLSDGRIGLFVVSAIARRHGIAVRLQNNIYGGIQAVVVLPHALLGGEEREHGSRPQVLAHQTIPPARREPAAGLSGQAPPAVAAAAAQAAGSAPPPHTEVPRFSNGHNDRPGSLGQPGGWEPRQTPVAPAAPAPPTFGPGAHAGPGAGTHDIRPQLPRRQAQKHLAPQLQNVPATRADEPPVEHDPGLVASFMQGVTRAESAADEDSGPTRP
ncbi:sensor histidine kinase [Micromonospora sp. NPDC006431]|uniref:sensor histidine kinase n=1 Tax=Micromonospora sp. NPDC006431 TaxID=3364235 RepID=UPI0036998509